MSTTCSSSPSLVQAMGDMRCRWMRAAWATVCRSPPPSSPRTSHSRCLSSASMVRAEVIAHSCLGMHSSCRQILTPPTAVSWVVGLHPK